MTEEDRRRGYVAPLDASGGASLYGPPPWRFFGRSLTVIAACDPAAVAALVPPPLVPLNGGLVRFSVHELVCDLGLGSDFAQTRPERSHMHEAVIGLAVTDGRRDGFFDPFLWCDSDAEIAVGREMFGWPQVHASLVLSRPDPAKGWQAGDRIVGRVSRAHARVMDLAMTVEAPGDWPVQVPSFSIFYTERLLPDPVSGAVRRELLASRMEDVSVGGIMAGRGEVALHADELRPLGPGRVVAARTNTVAWTKDKSVLVAAGTR